MPEIYLELLFWYNELTNNDDNFPKLNYHFNYLDLGDKLIEKDFTVFLEKGVFSHGIDALGFRKNKSIYSLISFVEKS